MGIPERSTVAFLLLLLLAVGLGSASAQSHVVKKDENLTTISQKYNTSITALAAINKLRKPYTLQVGQTLRLPATHQNYKIQKYDTLGKVASRFGVGLSDIQRANGISNPDRITVGQMIKIPVKGAFQAAPASAKKKHPALPVSVTMQLNRIKPRKAPWQFIVIHHTATESATFAGLDAYHLRERRMENGLAYHFVIGNGRGQRDGEIFVGRRWKEQLNGGHMNTEALNYKCLGICLVGNFETGRPTSRQLDSLKRLCLYLMKQNSLKPDKIAGHGTINSKPTACPGKNFDVKALVESLKEYE